MRFSGAHILAAQPLESSVFSQQRVSRNDFSYHRIRERGSSNRKIFWLLWTVLSLAGYFMPFRWAILETFVALWLSW